MQTIVINSQKGGSGKTTLCAHLSVQAEHTAPGSVYMIDTDPQGTLTTWHQKRAAETPQRIEVPFDNIASGLDLLRQRGAAYCFIDTPPSRSDELTALFRLADLVLVPINPSPVDLWAAAPTIAVLKREEIHFLFALNEVKANAGITAQAAASLSHHGPVAETFIGDRVQYAAALTDGRTAIELLRKGPAAIEIAALWKNIQACLHANIQHAKEYSHG